MFLGHYAAALAAKKLAPQTSLGTLLIGAQFLDLLWPFLLLAGVETVRIVPSDNAFTRLTFDYYPISHSLMMTAVWATLVSLGYYAVRRYSAGTILMWLLVMSHWILDLITHRPDLKLTPSGEAKVGFGLWNSFAGTIVIEIAIFAIAVIVYVKTTKARDRIGRYGFWIFVLVMVLLYLANAYGPAPPSVKTLAIVAMGQWLFVLWCYWIDRHRQLA